MKKIIILILTGIVCFALFSYYATAQSINNSEVFSISSNFGADASTQVHINWQSRISGTFVELKKTTQSWGEALVFFPATEQVVQFPAVGERFRTEGFEIPRYFMFVDITDLIPNTNYVFRIGLNQRSLEYFFTTASGGTAPFTFLQMSDPQYFNENTANHFNNIMTQAFNLRPDIRFSAFSGDIIDRAGRSSEWDLFFTRSNINRAPVSLAVGNHEFYDTSPTPLTVGPIFYNSFIRNPQNGPDALLNTAFYFVYNHAMFFFVDSEATDFNARNAQVNWFKDAVAREMPQFIIAFMHKSFYGNVYWNSAPQPRSLWINAFAEVGADLVMTGHDHVYMRSFPMANDEIVCASVGTIFLTGGPAGQRVHPYRDTAPHNAWNHFHEVVLQFDLDIRPAINGFRGMGTIVDVLEDRLVVTAIDAGGNVLDNFEIMNKRPHQTGDFDQNEFMNSINISNQQTTATITWQDYYFFDVERISVKEYGKDLFLLNQRFLNNIMPSLVFTLPVHQEVKLEVIVLFRDGNIKTRIFTTETFIRFGSIDNIVLTPTKRGGIITFETDFIPGAVSRLELLVNNRVTAIVGPTVTSFTFVLPEYGDYIISIRVLGQFAINLKEYHINYAFLPISTDAINNLEFIQNNNDISILFASNLDNNLVNKYQLFINNELIREIDSEERMFDVTLLNFGLFNIKIVAIDALNVVLTIYESVLNFASQDYGEITSIAVKTTQNGGILMFNHNLNLDVVLQAKLYIDDIFLTYINLLQANISFIIEKYGELNLALVLIGENNSEIKVINYAFTRTKFDVNQITNFKLTPVAGGFIATFDAEIEGDFIREFRILLNDRVAVILDINQREAKIILDRYATFFVRLIAVDFEDTEVFRQTIIFNNVPTDFGVISNINVVSNGLNFVLTFEANLKNNLVRSFEVHLNGEVIKTLTIDQREIALNVSEFGDHEIKLIALCANNETLFAYTINHNFANTTGCLKTNSSFGLLILLGSFLGFALISKKQ